MLTVLRTAALVLTVPAAASAATVVPGIGDFSWYGSNLGATSAAMKAKHGALIDASLSVKDMKGYGAAAEAAAPSEFAPKLASFEEDGVPPVLAPLMVVSPAGPSIAFSAPSPAVLAMSGAQESLTEVLEAVSEMGLDHVLLANLPSAGTLPQFVGNPFEALAAAASVRINTGSDLLLTEFSGDVELATMELYGITPAVGGGSASGGNGGGSTSSGGFPAMTLLDGLGGSGGGGGGTSDTVLAAETGSLGSTEPAPVPLPAGGALLLAGLVALGQLRRKSRKI